MRVVACVSEKPDDLTCIVDVKGLGAASGQGIVEGNKAAAGKQETVEAAGIGVIPDDLAALLMPRASVPLIPPLLAEGSFSVVNIPPLLRRNPWRPVASV